MSSVILPTDDLPSVFSKEVRLKFKRNELNTEFVFMAATRGFFLFRQGLTKHTSLFLRHEIDLQTFVTLTEEDFKEIGIHTVGARKKLLLVANSEFLTSTISALKSGVIKLTKVYILRSKAELFMLLLPK